jgi:hypothetical protein
LGAGAREELPASIVLEPDLVPGVTDIASDNLLAASDGCLNDAVGDRAG